MDYPKWVSKEGIRLTVANQEEEEAFFDGRAILQEVRSASGDHCPWSIIGIEPKPKPAAKKKKEE